MKKDWCAIERTTTRRRLQPAPALLSLALLMFFLLSLPVGAHAQNVAVAEVSGTVTDASGSAVAGAPVTMMETDKGIVHSTHTDATGHYILPNLPVGPYRLEVRVNGFKEYVNQGIVLQVANNIEINVPLEVGSTTQTVEVHASTSMVETKENAVGQVVDQRRISELPLNNRQETQLILVVGAAAYGDAGDTGSKTFYSSTRISVAGGQSNGTAYLLDGGDFTDAMSNVGMPTPFPDATQEFSIETSAVSSRFGTHPGATVNIVTKSGSNQLHGNLFEFLRNGDFDARNFFAANRDTLKRNQFGGTVGGKIIADKLFFFAGYQGTRNKSNPPQSITHIPTAQMLNGDFTTIASAACQSNGKAVTLKAPFVGNMISPTAFDQVAVNLTKYLPISSADLCGKVTYGIPVTGNEDQEIGRVDWVKSSKNTIYGRHLVDDYRNPPVFDGKNILTTTQPGNFERAQSATIGDTYTVSPTTLNSFHVSWNRLRDDRGPTSIPLTWTMLGSQMYSAVPNFLLISSMTGGFTTFCGTCAPGHFNFTSEQLSDDVDVIRGKHEFSFGANLIRIQNDTISGFDENGAPAFDGSFTGLGMGDFLLGKMHDFQQTNATPDDLRQWLMSVYAQDSFRVSSRFTLNYGLRWEPTFADPDKYGRGTSFSIPAFLAGTVSTVHPTAPAGLFFKGDPGIPPGMWNGHIANFGPRVGVVWDPTGSGKQTLRAGGAVLYDSAETWFNERETTNPPFGNDIDVGSTGTLTNPWAGYPGGNPFPQHGNLFFPQFGTYVNMPINPNPMYLAQWNVTYQRQFAHGWLASASYIGNKTTHLLITQEVDPAQFLGTGPCTINGTAYTVCSSTSNTNQRRRLYLTNPALGKYYASIDTADDGANAHYEGLLMSVQHRFESNFTLLANYTYSYCLSDYDSEDAMAGPRNSQPFNRAADYGRCVFDTRSIFNTSLVVQSPWKGNTWTDRVIKDWTVAPLLRAAGGQPIFPVTGTDNSLTGLGNDRPNQVLSDPYATSNTCTNAPCHQLLNPAGFVPNPTGTFGDVGRNAFRGPKFVNLDASLSRSFKLSERLSVQARGEAFNLLNHTNFVGQISPPGLIASFSTWTNGLNASTFGQSQSAFDPRILQFALKVIF